MYKNILFILLITLAGAGTALVFNRPEKMTPTTKVASLSTNEGTSSASDSAITQGKDGIEITITDIKQGDETTTLTLGLSNHRFDLGQDSIYNGATLDGKPSQSHTVLSNVMGGHHVEAEVVFKKTTSGSLVIAPVEGTTFTFDNLW